MQNDEDYAEEHPHARKMQNDEDYAEELEQLQGNLQQVQNKVLNQWTGEELDRYLEKQKREHQERMRKGQEEMAALHASLEQLKGQAKLNVQAMEKSVGQMRGMRAELEEMKSETDLALQEKEAGIEELAEKDSQVQKEKDLIEAQERATQQRITELEKSSEWFQERLGLKFKKTSGDRLQLVFTSIDHKDPQRPCFFSVKITSDGKFKVTDCEPEVEGMDKLLEKLNETNNFRAFVINVRKQFKAAL